MASDDVVWRITCPQLRLPLLGDEAFVTQHYEQCESKEHEHALDELRVMDVAPSSAPELTIEERLEAVNQAMGALNEGLHLLAVDADLIGVLRTLVLSVDELREVLRKMNEGVDTPRIVTPGVDRG